MRSVGRQEDEIVQRSQHRLDGGRVVDVREPVLVQPHELEQAAEHEHGGEGDPPPEGFAAIDWVCASCCCAGPGG